ncbi:DUF4262 domain-containing protein [Deinococcus sp. YIM 134068]|uniref:DUF4262 domain-containing protein n=1 Tax=Deinococcus lichenicola TaxID=3118910 RepID=UPI002F9446F0
MLDDIRRHGWHVIKVPADEEGPGFAFTLGLYARFDHPEVIIFGLDLDLMQQILNGIGDDVKAGERRYAAGRQESGVLEGYDCAFVEVAAPHFRDYLGTAVWLYRRQPFPALQCVWLDRAGAFPWEDRLDARFLPLQPLLDR